MAEQNVFFTRVKDVCKKTVYTCAPADRVIDLAETMRSHNVSGLFVCDGENPVGIITDRDLRNKVVAAAADPKELTAASIMNAPLVTVAEDDYIFEAVYKTSKHNIHRLAVLDGRGCLAGVISDSDIVKLQTNTPQHMIRDLEYAQTLGDLKDINDQVTELVISLQKTGVKTRDIVRLISYLNDSIVLRVIALLKQEEFPSLPESFSLLVLGSEGRMEQTLKTDQDNAIVYGDSLSEEEVRSLEAFSVRLIDALIDLGVPPCPGGIMAKNEPWRRSLADWDRVLSRWTSTPTPENILNYSMFSDLRTLYGDPALEKELKERVWRYVRVNSLFLAHMAKNVLRFPPPVGFFGRPRVEKMGEHRGKLDIKKGGIFPITEGIKVLALQAGILSGGTRTKIEALLDKGIISRDDALDIETSYNFFVFIRLRSQVESLTTGRKPSDFVNPNDLNYIERMRLKIGFSVVKSFQNLLKLRYRLNFISD